MFDLFNCLWDQNRYLNVTEYTFVSPWEVEIVFACFIVHFETSTCDAAWVKLVLFVQGMTSYLCTYLDTLHHFVVSRSYTKQGSDSSFHSMQCGGASTDSSFVAQLVA